jgi:hypothetical protein
MPEIKVIKKDNIDFKALAKESLTRQREQLADMKRRFNGFLSACEKKLKEEEDFLNLHLKGH